MQDRHIIIGKNWAEFYNKFYTHAVEVDNNMLEYTGLQFNFHPIEDRFCCCPGAGFDYRKAIALFAWYCVADNNNTWIDSILPQWGIDYSRRGYFPDLHTSNYGFYLFKYVDDVISSLTNNQSDRNVCITLGNNVKLYGWKHSEGICTQFIQFYIVGNKLDMFINMRASDVIRFLPYDIAAFSMFYELVYNSLTLGAKMPLEVGRLRYNVNIAQCHKGFITEYGQGGFSIEQYTEQIEMPKAFDNIEYIRKKLANAVNNRYIIKKDEKDYLIFLIEILKRIN